MRCTDGSRGLGLCKRITSVLRLPVAAAAAPASSIFSTSTTTEDQSIGVGVAGVPPFAGLARAGAHTPNRANKRTRTRQFLMATAVVQNATVVCVSRVVTRFSELCSSSRLQSMGREEGISMQPLSVDPIEPPSSTNGTTNNTTTTTTTTTTAPRQTNGRRYTYRVDTTPTAGVRSFSSACLAIHSNSPPSRHVTLHPPPRSSEVSACRRLPSATLPCSTM